jgi:hypothetical protein
MWVNNVEVDLKSCKVFGLLTGSEKVPTAASWKYSNKSYKSTTKMIVEIL